jgi:hypothetical protein
MAAQHCHTSLLMCNQRLTNLFVYSVAYAVNPYGLWTIALHEHFADAVEHVDRIKDEHATQHSIIDAIRFFDGKRPICFTTDRLDFISTCLPYVISCVD